MQTLAVGVGDLKKVLSNVKTRGILGEIQLGAILEEILAPEQYKTNVVTKSGRDAVEFVVCLPGSDDSEVYLPIDSKFPADMYANLVDAYDVGDTAQITAAAAALERSTSNRQRRFTINTSIRRRRRILQLCFCRLKGFMLKSCGAGLVEVLQRDYKISIAGPTTMASLLNSLQGL